MRHQFLVILGLLAVVAGAGCTAQHRVHKVSGRNLADPIKVQGVYYALPRTVVSVTLPVELVVQEPGQFVGFVGELKDGKLIQLPKGTYTTKKSNFYRIGTPVVGTRLEADPDEVYLVQVAGGQFENKSLTLELSEAGFLITGESKVEDKTAEIAVTTLESVASIAGKLITFGAGSPTTQIAAQDRLEAAAKDVLAQIVRVQQQRTALAAAANPGLAGTPVSKETLDRLFGELDAIEKGLLSNFTGAERVKRVELKFEVRPRVGQSSAPYELVTFSNVAGVSPLQAGVYIPPAFRKTLTADLPDEPDAAPKRVVLTLAADPGTQMADTIRSSHPKIAEVNGFFYRVPSTATATLAVGDAERTKDRMAVAQWGVVAALPTDTGSSSSQYNVSMYDSSGALKKVTIGSTALDQKLISRSAGVANSLIDAEQARLNASRERSKAEQAAQSDLAKLKAERALLEEQLAIQKLREQLGVKPE